MFCPRHHGSSQPVIFYVINGIVPAPMSRGFKAYCFKLILRDGAFVRSSVKGGGILSNTYDPFQPSVVRKLDSY